MVNIFFRQQALKYSLVSRQLAQAPDSDIEQLFWQQYREYKNIAHTFHGESLDWQRFTFSAVGLLTFGHIDAVEDIVDNMPPRPEEGPSGYGRKIPPGALAELLPIPSDIDEGTIVDDPEAFRTWFHAHRDRMVWDADQGRFILRED